MIRGAGSRQQPSQTPMAFEESSYCSSSPSGQNHGRASPVSSLRQVSVVLSPLIVSSWHRSLVVVVEEERKLSKLGGVLLNESRINLVIIAIYSVNSWLFGG